MRCTSCDTENDEGSKFCMTCGTPLETTSTEPADASPPPPVADAAPPPAEPPAPPTEEPPPPPSGEWAAAAPPPPPPSGEWAAQPADMPPPPPTDWSAGPPPAPAAPPPPAPEAAPPEWAAPPAPAPGEAAAPPPPAAWGATAAPQPPPAASGQWAQPPQAPGQPPQGYAAPPVPTGPVDPNALGASAGRLGNRARKDARAALAIAGVVLEDGEAVEALVAGKHEGNAALLVLTDRGLLLIDDRQWKPHVERIEITQGLQVQGTQDRTATLALFDAGRQWTVDQIADGPLAVEMAQRLRYRASIA